MTIRLLIAEDHELLRQGLRAIFENTEIEVVGEAGNVADAIDRALSDDADVMLLDINMPGGDGFDVLEAVLGAKPEMGVLVYSQHQRPDFQDRARQLGALGYLSKLTTAGTLIDGVRRASQRQNLWQETNDNHDLVF